MPQPGGHMFYIGLHREHVKNSSCLKPQGIEPGYFVCNISKCTFTKVVQIMSLGLKMAPPRGAHVLHTLIKGTHLPLTPGLGSKAILFSFLKVLMLHIKLNGMKHRTLFKHLFCPFTHPRPLYEVQRSNQWGHTFYICLFREDMKRSSCLKSRGRGLIFGFVASSSRHLPSVFKICPGGKNAKARGSHVLHRLIQGTCKKFFLSETTMHKALIFGM